MSSAMASPRLFVAADLTAGARVELDAAQANYLFNVMRLKPSDPVRLFNGRAGEWTATVGEVARKSGVLQVGERTRDHYVPPDLHVLFAPVKKSRTDYIVEKATELGATALRPVFTRRTVAERVKTERLRAVAVEAAEQTERLDVPDIAEAQPLARVLEGWTRTDPGRSILFLDEAAGGADTPWREAAASGAAPVLRALFAVPETEAGGWAILVGPEGGFAPDERERLRTATFVTCASLGPRILRADTAVVAALTAWQSVLGDWR